MTVIKICWYYLVSWCIIFPPVILIIFENQEKFCLFPDKDLVSSKTWFNCGHVQLSTLRVSTLLFVMLAMFLLWYPKFGPSVGKKILSRESLAPIYWLFEKELARTFTAYR